LFLFFWCRGFDLLARSDARRVGERFWIAMRQRYWRTDGVLHEHLRNWIRFDARANDGPDNFELTRAEASADWQNRSLDPCCQVFIGRQRLRRPTP